jgi:uncharacterized membrane protein YfcA
MWAAMSLGSIVGAAAGAVLVAAAPAGLLRLGLGLLLIYVAAKTLRPHRRRIVLAHLPNA